ncbi:MAG: DnaD domain protein [Anaerolineae bacterium]
MKGFAGIPEGKVRFTPLPDLFFSQLMPRIDNLPELKVTLHLFWLLQGKKGHLRYASLQELREDPLLLAGLSVKDPEGKVAGRRPEDLLDEGLERAVARGTLLRVGDSQESWYFVNDPPSRQAVEEIERGELRLEGMVSRPGEGVEVERPNIFALYEQNIGLLQPLIAEELREAEKTYPPAWIEKAFKIAVERNARNWRYIQAILQRWAREGKDDGAPKRGSKEDRYRYFKGKYADYLEE